MPVAIASTAFLAPRRALVSDDPMTILDFATSFSGRSCLVTLVEIRGGAAKPLGAQMVVRETGDFCGYISGGCTEAAVAAEAIATLRSGHDRFLKLGSGSPFFDIVLPCGGGITLALHVVRDTKILGAVATKVRDRSRTGLRYDPAHQEMAISDDTQPGWRDGAFCVSYRPKVRVAIAGNGIEAATLNIMATASHYDAVELDVGAQLDGDSAVALLFHDLDREAAILEHVLQTNAFYIGALGSRRTHDRRIDRLLKLGCSDEQVRKIKGPIGLFGPARDANSLAISVLADIAATSRA